jgi:membrane protein implicated in regulation of membrane protease activity
MLWSFWAISAVILLIVEIMTPGTFFFACLSIGAVATVIVSLFSLSFWTQCLVFIIVSVLSIYFIRPIASKFFIVQKKKSNVDALIGQDAWVAEAVEPPNMGMVKVVGALWRAEAQDRIEKDKWVTILAVKGSHLVVKPK